MAPSSFKGEGINASNINNLLANVDSRLKGGLHGQFYEEGSKLGDSHRHEQLATLFELKEQLSTIQSEMQKKTHQAEDEDSQNSKGPVKVNANLIKTIKTVVQQEMADKLRSLSIENERLRESAKKANELGEAQEAKVKTLEAKVKKLELQEKVKTGEARIKALEGKVTQLNEHKEKTVETLDEHERQSNRNVKAYDAAITELQTGELNLDERLQDLETWQSEHVSLHDVLSRWLK